MRKYISFFMIAVFVLPSLQGCASKYGEQRTAVNYYPACYRPIYDLRDREHSVTKSSVGGALIGALGGALIGLLGSGGKWQGAAVGAATGGAAGAITGGMYGNSQQQAEDNRRMAEYLENLNGDISHLDISAAAAKTSLQCYDKQFQALLSQIKARKISRDVAWARFREISDGREEAIAILGDAAEAGRNLERQYEQAFAQEERQVQQVEQTRPGTLGAQRQRAAINRARQRKTELTRKTGAINEEKLNAQNNTISQREEMKAEIDRIYQNAVDARI